MAVTVILLALTAGSAVYCVLTVLAARRYLGAKPVPLEESPPVSVLKPLSGAEPGLEENLRGFFEQIYPAYEILFAVRGENDPAVAVVSRLQARFPQVPSRLIVTGEPPYPNAKVFSLDCMKAAAAHDLLVMSDSDIRVSPDFLRVIAAEFRASRVGLVTCPYRAVPGRSFWSKLEAVGMNTQFLSGVLVARMLEGMKFALGPTIAARKRVLDEMGGFERLKDYLAEDFVMGKVAEELGYEVVLSSYVIEHHIGSHGFATNLEHRLRWARSTRRSRPKGYAGELFTHTLAVALILWAWEPRLWLIALGAVLLRAVAAGAVAGWVLKDPLTIRKFWLLPIQDIAAFLTWIAGFFGNRIIWRGRGYYLLRDGRFELA